MKLGPNEALIGAARYEGELATPALLLADVVKSYGPVRAVDGVSLTVPAGSITAVLGANGAGKSSLLRAVSGIVRPQSGRVRFCGEDITRQGAEDIVRRGLAHVPEGGGVIQELTVEEKMRLQGQIQSLMMKGDFLNDEFLSEVRALIK